MQLDFCEDYVLYIGSLTTPPCTGDITWIISSRPMLISLEQVSICDVYLSTGQPLRNLFLFAVRII